MFVDYVDPTPDGSSALVEASTFGKLSGGLLTIPGRGG